MKKLFWIKFRATRIDGRVVNVGHKRARSEAQIVSLIIKRGPENIEKIMHDDQPRNTRQISGKEMLHLWKQVEKIKSRQR